MIESKIQTTTVPIIPDYLIFSVDGFGNIEQWNDQLYRFFGFDECQILQKPFWNLIDENQGKGNEMELKLHQSVVESGFKTEIRLKTKNNTKYNAALSIKPIIDSQNEILGFTLLISNICLVVSKNIEKHDYINFSKDKEHIKQLELKIKWLEQNLNLLASTLSHDLKAPLRAIAGYMRIIEEEYVQKLNADERKIISFMHSNLEKTTGLTEQLVSFARICSRELKFSEIDMEELIIGVVGEFNSQNSNKAQISIAKMPTIQGDYSLIHLLFTQLISNAVKFSSFNEHSEVSVNSFEREDAFVFCVEDNGIGFDLKFAKNIFKNVGRFHTHKELPGAGIGLVLSWKIAEKHLGSLWIESEPGKFSKVYFSIPKNFTNQYLL